MQVFFLLMTLNFIVLFNYLSRTTKKKKKKKKKKQMKLNFYAFENKKNKFD